MENMLQVYNGISNIEKMNELKLRESTWMIIENIISMGKSNHKVSYADAKLGNMQSMTFYSWTHLYILKV